MSNMAIVRIVWYPFEKECGICLAIVLKKKKRKSLQGCSNTLSLDLLALLYNAIWVFLFFDPVSHL